MTANEPKVRGRLILPDERAARAALNLLKELIVVESHHIQKHGGLVSLSIKGLIRLDVVAEAEDNELTINELRDLGWVAEAEDNDLTINELRDLGWNVEDLF